MDIHSRSTRFSPCARDDEALGGRITAVRQLAGLSQAELGRSIRVTQTVVSRWELDKLEPGLAHLLLVASATGAPIDALLAPAGRGRVRHHHPEDTRLGAQIGRHLRHEREEHGWDPYAFGRRAGVVPRRLRKLEQGAAPSVGELLRIVTALDQRVSEFLAAAGLDTLADLHRVRVVEPHGRAQRTRR